MQPMTKTKKIFKSDLDEICANGKPYWEKFHGKTFFITGGTGLVGYTVISALAYYNRLHSAGIRVIALVRDIPRAEEKFAKLLAESPCVSFVEGSVEAFPEISENIDYILHSACPTSSAYFAAQPVDTIRAIVMGTDNVLQLAVKKNVSGMVYLSSMEAYGQITEKRPLKESELGFVDVTDPRSSYPMGKRMAENLCCSYARQYGLRASVIRLVQCFGPGVAYNEQKVFAHMLRSVLGGEDIRLMTDGTKENQYVYTFDAASAIFSLLTDGAAGEIYNVANESTYCSVKEMGQLVIDTLGTPEQKVITNAGGDTSLFRPQGYLMLSTEKLRSLGWEAKVPLAEMYRRTTESFKNED